MLNLFSRMQRVSTKQFIKVVLGFLIFCGGWIYQGIPLAEIPTKESAERLYGKVSFFPGGRSGSSFRIDGNPYACSYSRIRGPIFSCVPGGRIWDGKSVKATWFATPGLFVDDVRFLLELQDVRSGEVILHYEDQRRRLRVEHSDATGLVALRFVASILAIAVWLSVIKQLINNPKK